ncbi:o-succinylbenzoate--CoA ligase [Vagococcus penaei]|uniref:2-succinylbenzoate--CoA ligase n=1 Tax=Vagococcus penaei TaxID=633807 RepID=A0A1Q2D5V9_9ENTE|nr:o-succinylbenzoate--CoA ligase [Vagococcus penaei]AQP53713.1 o-succinylbenzoate--CoA ligase [Vagococcus penaei]RST99461.1 o-succinylbenzoate--CoA ligase [Vagococcus penaei]
MNWLVKQINERPNHPALYVDDTVWTFAAIGRNVQQWMGYFSTIVPETTKRVAVLSHNSSAHYFTIVALWSLGKEVVCLNTHLQPEELEYQLDDAQVSFVIVDEFSQKKLTQLTGLMVIPMSLPQKHFSDSPWQDMGLDDVATIMYTSGTTGRPKGVVQRFAQHLASAKGTAQNVSITADDCWLCAVPLFHISGLSLICRQLILGCSIRLYRKFSATEVTRDLVAGKGSVMSVVTLMLNDLLKAYPPTGYHDCFRFFLLGGGPVSVATLETCQKLELPVIQSYGMTETCSQVVALSFADALTHLGSVGKPLANMVIKIVDALNQEVPALVTGEIWLKGPNIVTNYLHDTTWHDTKWTTDGWFRTGDMGYLTEDGYLYLVSRLSELIISGGENVYPTEVEQVLQQISSVQEVAVVGESHPKWGAVPVAYIVGHLTKAEMEDYLSSRLAKYKWPVAIYRCHNLPRTASGKLAKHRLLTKERDEYLWKSQN